VTRADGRILYEIDGRPAAEVYNDWTDGVLQDAFATDEQNVLPLTTLYPLGRVVGSVGGTAYHQLSHPDHITPERGLSLFSDVEVGDELWLMKGTRQSLVERAGRVARAAMRTGDIQPDNIAGGLVIYCAGCMLTVQDQWITWLGILMTPWKDAPSWARLPLANRAALSVVKIAMEI